MQAYEKLDFLMNLTKTTNSALSLAVSLDASYVSRLRRGGRSLSGKETHIRHMAAYFARHLDGSYQRRVLCETMGRGPDSVEDDSLPELIALWLLSSGKKERELRTIESFLSGFSQSGRAEKPRETPSAGTARLELIQEKIAVFYGVEGKRQAVVHFLSEVISCPRPRTLLLFSDEPTGWMTEDRVFAAKWASLMRETLSRGNKIRIIHTVSRDLDEMLSAIIQWMPLYMSGLIEPYYYPKKRDGVFKRTLFIAPEIAAIMSNSIGNMSSRAANFLLREKDIVRTAEEEFNQYLALCRPLMRVFSARDEERFCNTLLEFERQRADTVIRTQSLSALTMPQSLAKQILARYGGGKAGYSAFQKARLRLFGEHLQSGGSFTEIIRLPGPDLVKNGKIKVALSDLMTGEAVYYTVGEYIEHLEHLACLLETYQNFHVYLAENLKEENYIVYAREDLGVIVAKTHGPLVALAVSESNITAAFWNYLVSLMGDSAYAGPDNRAAAEKLRAYARRLAED